MLINYMSDATVRLARGRERRAVVSSGIPPFITEEGLVLVDRRSYAERRQQPRLGNGGNKRQIPQAA